MQRHPNRWTKPLKIPVHRIGHSNALKKGCFCLIRGKEKTLTSLKIRVLRHFAYCFGGERGIRTPGPSQANGFQDRRDRPLCHFSAAKVELFYVLPKQLSLFLNIINNIIIECNINYSNVFLKTDLIIDFHILI